MDDRNVERPFARGGAYACRARSGVAVGAMALWLGLAACSGGGSKGDGSTYSISGTVAGAVAAGVTMTLGGTATATTTTDGSGGYTFAGLANGSYTVTPSKAGYTFAPASRDVPVNGANVTGQDFTATRSTYTISGRVIGTSPGEVTISLTGTSSASTSTDANGDYSFPGLASGTYTITPSKTGYTFTPTKLDVAIGAADLAGQNFGEIAATYSVSGQVTGTSPSEVTVSLTGTSNASTSTDANGNYSFPGLASGSYTITPSKTGYEFTPTNLDVTVGTVNVTGQDFAVGSGNWDYMVWDQDKWK